MGRSSIDAHFHSAIVVYVPGFGTTYLELGGSIFFLTEFSLRTLKLRRDR